MDNYIPTDVPVLYIGSVFVYRLAFQWLFSYFPLIQLDSVFVISV